MTLQAGKWVTELVGGGTAVMMVGAAIAADP
jgi:hypothetical protein